MSDPAHGRVLLRPLHAEDTDLIVRWRSDAEVRRQLFSAQAPTREEHDRWFAGLQGRRDREEFVIVVAGTGVPVGTVGLSSIGHPPGEAEYGILIGEPAWRGKGLARDASLAILEHAFGHHGLGSVRLECFADNEPAVRLYRSLGFEPASAGERLTEDGARATVLMRLDRDRWRALHG